MACESPTVYDLGCVSWEEKKLENHLPKEDYARPSVESASNRLVECSLRSWALFRPRRSLRALRRYPILLLSLTCCLENGVVFSSNRGAISSRQEFRRTDLGAATRGIAVADLLRLGLLTNSTNVCLPTSSVYQRPLVESLRSIPRDILLAKEILSL